MKSEISNNLLISQVIYIFSTIRNLICVMMLFNVALMDPLEGNVLWLEMDFWLENELTLVSLYLVISYYFKSAIKSHQTAIHSNKVHSLLLIY